MLDDAVRAVVELAVSQHGVLSRRQAAELSIDRGRLVRAVRRGWLDERYPGVFLVSGAVSSWHQLIKAATLAGGGHAVASHRSAARLHGLDGFAAATTVVRAHRWRYRDGTVVHHVEALERSDIVELEGIPCTGLARTLTDLGSVCDSLSVRRALTDARRRGTTLRWMQLTAERLHRPGQRGSAALLAQLASIPYEGCPPDSWFEELLAVVKQVVAARRGEVCPERAVSPHMGHTSHGLARRPVSMGSWPGVIPGRWR